VALVTTRTGPGGTEVLARPTSLDRKAAPQSKPAIPLAPEHSASHLRKTVEETNQLLANGKNGLSEGLRHKLELALGQRQQFWIDTCREVVEMRTASRQVLELHRQHGCRFGVPAPRQVQYILDALDSALPAWDQDHPELFYRTLELNFPELLRVCRAQRRG